MGGIGNTESHSHTPLLMTDVLTAGRCIRAFSTIDNANNEAQSPLHHLDVPSESDTEPENVATNKDNCGTFHFCCFIHYGCKISDKA